MNSTQVLLVVVALLTVANLGVLLFFFARLRRELGAELRRGVDADMAAGRKAMEEALREGRREAGDSASQLRTEVSAQITAVGGELSKRLDVVDVTLNTRIRELQDQNDRKLEEMRKTVDEKLQGTLERRLGEAFGQVSERLESVKKSVGEMQTLAADVGSLQRTLTNVKIRGTWAEVQLGALLEQFLAPGQFERNARTKEGSADLVEFAVRLPGPTNDPERPVLLPIDSKFPQEDYLRIQDAAERGDPEAVQRETDALARTLRAEAKKIQEKYLDPPNTTDFAIMFLATEGLYAEALRYPGLVGEMQTKHKVVVAGPTTLAAILNSLRMGFQTLAIEKRASEVWTVLGAVKSEFEKFGDVLAKVKRQLETAGRTIDQAGTRTRAMERRLREVEQVPEAKAQEMLGLGAGLGDDAGEPGWDEDEAGDDYGEG
jgi:DNA recombination protein RmuC